MKRRTKKAADESAVEPAFEYIDDWRELIDTTPDPHKLLGRWRAERDQRDKLGIPIAQRLDLLRLIAPDEVG
jgi:hypothetical protein